MTPEQHIAALTMPFTQYGAANLSPLSHLVSGEEWVKKIRGVTIWIYIPGYAINPVPAFDVAWHKIIIELKLEI